MPFGHWGNWRRNVNDFFATGATALGLQKAYHSMPPLHRPWSRTNPGEERTYNRMARRYYRRRAAVSKKRKRSGSGSGPGPKRVKQSQKPSALTKYQDTKVSRYSRRIGGRKKNWLRFKSKVDKAVNANTALVSFVESLNAYSMDSTGNNDHVQQIMPHTQNSVNDTRIGLYGEDTTGLRRFIVELRDKARIGITKTAADNVLGVFSDLSSEKLFLKNCSANMAIYNRSAADPIIVDIYECVSRTTINNTAYHTAQACWDACLADSYDFTQSAGAAFTATRQASTSSGATPFTCPDFGKYWKVLKRTRTVVQAGEWSNYRYAGYKGKVSFETDLALGSIPKGKCKDLLVVAAPTANSRSPASGAYLQIEITKKYTLAWEDAPGKDIGYAAFYTIT